jgi:hypothetical protein
VSRRRVGLHDDSHRPRARLFGRLDPSVEQHADARIQPVLGRIPWPHQDHVGPPERHRVQYRLFCTAVESSTDQRASGKRMQLVRQFRTAPGHGLHLPSRDYDRDLLVTLPESLKN